MLTKLKSIKLLLQTKNSKQKIISLLVLATLIFTLPVAVYLIQKKVLFRSKAAAEVRLYLQPSSATMPPNTNLNLMVNAGTNSVGFVRAEVTFDPAMVTLSGEPQVTGPLTTVVSLSTMAEANASGKVLVVLGLATQNRNSPPTGTFELVRLPFQVATALKNQSATISINASGGQVVDMNAAPLTYEVGSSALSLNPYTPGAGQISLSSGATHNVGEVFPVNIMFNTGGEPISSISLRITYPYSGTTPELQVVDQSGNPASKVFPDSTLISSGEWTFPINSATASGGVVTIDLSSINTSLSGFYSSSSTLTNLGTIYLKGTRVTNSPISLSFDPVETLMMTKASPSQNIVSSPSGISVSLVEAEAKLGLSFSIQGVATPSVNKSFDITITDGSTTKVYPNPFTSATGGVFTTSSPITLTGLPVASGGTSYNVLAKTSGYLRKRLGNISLTPGANTAPSSWSGLKLIAGDFDGNNILNIVDIGQILSIYTALSVPVSQSNQIYDLDANAVINISDIATVLSNYVALQISGD